MPTEAELKQRLSWYYTERTRRQTAGETAFQLTTLEGKILTLEKRLKRIAFDADPVNQLAEIQKRLKWLKTQIGIYEFEYKGLTEEANQLQDQIDAKKKGEHR